MIRIGVVGFGHRIACVVSGHLHKVAPDVRVVGIVDPNEPAVRPRLWEACDRETAEFYPDLATMMRKARLDGLMIGTRCHLHTPYAIEAARYEVPLYLEKPVAISIKQAQALERAYEKSKCPVIVSFPLRVSPLCELTRQGIGEGAVGRPEHILAVNYVPYGTCYWEEQYRNYTITQGLFLQKATHDFDYMSYLIGAPIVRVAAMANYGRVFGGKKPLGLHCAICQEHDACLESPQNRARNGAGGSTKDHPCVFSLDSGTPESGTNEDCSSALVEFKSGVQGVYTQVFYARRDAAARGATVSGYHGTLKFDWYQNTLIHVRHHAPFTSTTKAGEGQSHFGGDHELARNFIAMIQGKAQSRAPIQAGIQSVYACLAAKESATTGRFVKVRQVGG